VYIYIYMCYEEIVCLMINKRKLDKRNSVSVTGQ